jgi:hypothetical protein
MYDARSRMTAPGGGNELFFGLGILVVAAVVFLAVWKGPDIFSGGGMGADPERARIAEVFPDARMQDVILGMKEVDPAGYAEFARGFDRGDTPVAMRANFTEWNELFYISNMPTLAYIDMKYVDEVMELSRDALKSLSAQNSRWCSGGTYLAYQGMSESRIQSEMKRLISGADRPGTPLYEFSLEMNLIMVEAIQQAQRKPKRYGKPGSDDMMTLMMTVQGLQKSPEFAMFRSGRQPTPSQIASADVCKMGSRLLKVAIALPRSTKGKIWQASLTGELDPGGMAGLR